MKEFISHSATIFPVDNPLASAEYYRDKLGFEITFKWEDPPSYIVTKLGESVSIHFVNRADDRKPSRVHVAMMIFTHDVDKVYKRLKENEVEIINPIGTRDYGMRDFDIKDPDGYILSFGQGLEN
ncbi:MAG: VOC family protein [Bacteroidota bacterium]